METSRNTVKVAQHNEISPMRYVVISFCCALLGQHTNPFKKLDFRTVEPSNQPK